MNRFKLSKFAAVVLAAFASPVFAQSVAFQPPVTYTGPNFTPIVSQNVLNFLPQAQDYHLAACNGEAGCLNATYNAMDIAQTGALLVGQELNNTQNALNGYITGLYTRISNQQVNAYAYTDYKFSQVTQQPAGVSKEYVDQSSSDAVSQSISTSNIYTDGKIDGLRSAVTSEIAAGNASTLLTSKIFANSAANQALTTAAAYTDIAATKSVLESNSYSDAVTTKKFNQSIAFTSSMSADDRAYTDKVGAAAVATGRAYVDNVAQQLRQYSDANSVADRRYTDDSVGALANSTGRALASLDSKQTAYTDQVRADMSALIAQKRLEARRYAAQGVSSAMAMPSAPAGAGKWFGAGIATYGGATSLGATLAYENGSGQTMSASLSRPLNSGGSTGIRIQGGTKF